MLKSKESSYIFIRWTFSRFLALIYFFAFLSVHEQILGLYGENGIVPISKVMTLNFPVPSTETFLALPTVFQFWNNDSALSLVTSLGIFASLIALIGFFSGPCLLVCWLLYLSIVNAGTVFMSFQWDILLLEVGFLAIFFCSWKPVDSLLGLVDYINPKCSWIFERGSPSIILVWLYRWLLFRLIFESGLVKFAKEDKQDAWVNLTALSYHYETQPLPTPIGWVFNQFPDWIHSLSAIGTFAIELVVPFLFFMPSKIRYLGGIVQIGLQLLIIWTGNYCFFNLLTIALCLFLFDDQFFEILTRKKFSQAIRTRLMPSRSSIPGSIVVLAVSFIVLFSSSLMFALTNPIVRTLPPQAIGILKPFFPFHIASSYGLFARMTLDRPEILVEASMDGVNWEPYVFKYKIGPVNRMPPMIAPMQPRLDWQMWFASLGELEHSPWFLSFTKRLLENSSEVKSLLASCPFGVNPPKYIRARTFDYKMTDTGELLSTGAWWKMTYLREFMPPVSLYELSRY